MKAKGPWPSNLVVDEAQASGALAVFPVRSADRAADPDDYLPLAKALDMGLVKITEVSEGGNVPRLRLENKAKLPVLCVQGEELKGAKQNRTLNTTVLAKPGKLDIPVTCVEMGRWNWQSRHFTVGHMESPDLRLRKMMAMTLARRAQDEAGAPVERLARYGSDQGMVWSQVADEAAAMGVDSRTSAMADTYEASHTKRSVGEITDVFRFPDDACGAVVAIGGELQMAEVFESRAVFRALWPRLVRSYALQSLRARANGVPDRWKAIKFLDAPLRKSPVIEPSVSLGNDVRWDKKKFTAAALAWKERTLHGVVFAKRH